MLLWQSLHVVFVLSAAGVRQREGQKKGERRVVSRLWMVFLFAIKDRDKFAKMTLWLLLLASDKKLMWLIGVFSFFCFPPVDTLPSSFPCVLWDSLLVPSVPEAFSRGLSHSQCPTLLHASLSPEWPGNYSITAFLQHVIWTSVYVSVFPTSLGPP